MSPSERLQSSISLLLLGTVLLVLGGLLGVNGAAILAVVCMALGAFFCAVGMGVSRQRGRG